MSTARHVHKLTPKTTADKTTARLRRIHPGRPAPRGSVLPKSLRPRSRQPRPTPRAAAGTARYLCLVCWDANPARAAHLAVIVRRPGKHSNHRHPGQVRFQLVETKAAAA